ncbi:hypothetical protein DCAR_0101468 [Daucus carota subsp. sativus]|uniref:Uncharacterized protein n=1 Tax=Daucus carota subsp. sativus TaxID=79200 RepID=A0AAF1AJD8_DAUCS|nr:hypothetical protein DCAR_0101468 [Daucus carota subsp. sativus]
MLHLAQGDIAQLVDNGEEDRNMPVKDSTKTKMRCQERWAVGQIQYESEEDQVVIVNSLMNYKDHPKDAFGIQGSRTDHRTLEGSSTFPVLPVARSSGTTRIFIALWRAQYDESCKLCLGGVLCIYPIYDLSFMDVDKIHPFSSTLGWPSLKVKGEVKMRKALRWIPRHPEMRRGVVSDEMLRGVENKRRSRDSRIGQPFKLLLNPWAGKRQPGELKHLSSQRKRNQKRFP